VLEKLSVGRSRKEWTVDNNMNLNDGGSWICRLGDVLNVALGYYSYRAFKCCQSYCPVHCSALNVDQCFETVV
jgi:hypothetical protein